MRKEELMDRTKRFALDTVKLYDEIPLTTAVKIYFHQLIRSSSSVGANYRAACRAKSSADFINKLKIVEEEADESIYFLELVLELNKNHKESIMRLIKEGNELVSIFVASINTARKGIKITKPEDTVSSQSKI